MNDLEAQLGKELATAFASKGYESLTAVQAAVLAPAVQGRDLRISSQTGSGKTVALGLAIRDAIVTGDGIRALVIEPTRELAKQVEEELTWLFAPSGLGVASVTGGASYRDERRALQQNPRVLVGTPGRLLDHLERGSVILGATHAVVLDEADRLLDMGFREDLERILGFTPKERSTHLVSATFPREVKTLADSVQREPVHVEGTALGAANTDIEHIIHLVDPRDRLSALNNLLLSEPDGQTLVFARTRADVAEIADALLDVGFAVRPLSGEMQQRERERALAAFKRGELHALIATDVAARGIDVQDVARVIQMEPPTDADTYTHRSGRTGRAGRKGESILLVAPPTLARTRFLLKRANVTPRFAPIPTADEIRKAAADRVHEALTAPPPEGFAGFDESTWALAKRLASGDEVARTVARLLARTRWAGPAEPRDVRAIPPPEETPKRTVHPARRDRTDRAWAPFRITTGREHGATPQRLLAMVCRRGGIESVDVGGIRIGPRASTVEIAAEIADDFEAAASQVDARDGRVTIRRERAPHAREYAAPHAREHAPPHAREHAPPHARGERVEHVERPRPEHAARAEHHERPRPRPERVERPRSRPGPPQVERPRSRPEPPPAERPRSHEPTSRESTTKPRGKPTHPKSAHAKPANAKPTHAKPTHAKPAHGKHDKSEPPRYGDSRPRRRPG
ncbi:MAG: DEAD/DEAH box helicase [Deltaproteobacteria bacterium]|nr:DEAD/DEAH box helicase [Deltaproteobacteria bacterium]